MPGGSINATPNAAHPVVIVGAGPVGLVAACELARRGIAVRVIDKLSAPTVESRAIAVHARSSEMFDRMGVAEELVAIGVKSTGMEMFGKRNKLFEVHLDGVPSPFAYTLVTAQTETERVLTQRLTELGVSVERGRELVTWLKTGPVRCSRSAARTVPPNKSEHPGRSAAMAATASSAICWASDFRAASTASNSSSATSRPNTTWTTLTCTPTSPRTDRWSPCRCAVVAFALWPRCTKPEGEALTVQPTQEELQQILDERIGGIRITRSHWLAGFEIHHGQVDAYRHGRVFLAGDAAHIHSPAAGQGMNTGMQDAFNLGWKLAMVISGEAGESLLDSYHAERHPIAGGVIGFTTTLTKVATLQGAARIIRAGIVRIVGNLPLANHRMAAVVEETTVAYRRSPVIVPTVGRSKVVAGDHFPHVRDANLQKQLGGTFGTGHAVITIANNQVAPPAGGPGRVQVLVTKSDTPVAGYNAVIADPRGLLAPRLGLKRGGRIVVRPDDYLGAITTLDSPTPISNYFARIAA